MAKKPAEPREYDPSTEVLPTPREVELAAHVELMNSPAQPPSPPQAADPEILPAPRRVEPTPKPKGRYLGNVNAILGSLWEDAAGNVYELDETGNGIFLLRPMWKNNHAGS